MRSLHFVLAAIAIMCCFSLAASAQTTYAYTANTLGSSISIYKLNTTTGALTQTGGSPFQNDSPAYLAASASGKFLVVSGGQCPACGLQTFAITPTSGALTFSHSYDQIGSVLFLVGQIASDATGNTIYAQGSIQSGGVVDGAIDALHVNTDGSLIQVGTPFDFGEGVDASGEGPLAVDPKGRWVFAIITDSNTQQQLLVEIPRNTDGSLGNVDSSVSLTVQKCNNNAVLPLIAIDPRERTYSSPAIPTAARRRLPASRFTESIKLLDSSLVWTHLPRRTSLKLSQWIARAGGFFLLLKNQTWLSHFTLIAILTSLPC